MSKKYPRISFDPATQIVGSGILYQRWTNITCETYWEGINMVSFPCIFRPVQVTRLIALSLFLSLSLSRRSLAQTFGGTPVSCPFFSL